jgi:CRISPR-associated protein Csx14
MIAGAPDIILDVDLRNPGQFFACCGLLELASRLWPGRAENSFQGPEGWFATEGKRPSFQLASHSGRNDPLGEIVARLRDADNLVMIVDDEDVKEMQPDRKPVRIVPFDNLRLDWWLDSYRGGDKSELKVWAGQQTPERNINSLKAAWAEFAKRNPNSPMTGLLTQRWPLKGRFGFDPSASWQSINIGFSPDAQGIGVLTSPATEILAAIGLQRCRPRRVEARGRYFVYRPWTDPLEIALVPAAIAGAGSPISTYMFPVNMRNSQYGSFGWAQIWEDEK